MLNHILVPVSPSHIGDNGQAMVAAKKLLTSSGKNSVLSVLEAIPTYAEIQQPANYLEKNIAEVTEVLKAELA